MKCEIIEATTAEDYTAGKNLIEEYAEALGVDLCFQNFSKEIAELPKIYGPPHGCLLLARIDGETVGCVAVRSQRDTVCEMKRLYVRPTFRGTGLGLLLATSLIETAREIGYQKMRLDTLPGKMDRAIAMYQRLGFKNIDPYYFNPVENAAFMELELGPPM